jgi:signal peptidase II
MTGNSTARPLWGPFLGMVAAIVVIDQATKAWITAELAGGRVLEFLGGALRLIYSENNGALFGLFRGQVFLFALLSLGVIGLIIWFHGRSGRSPYMTLTLGLLLGGAIGNAIDRFRLGFVIDFVDGGVGSVRFYTFNVADACISGSIVLLLTMAIWPSVVGVSRARSARDELPGAMPSGVAPSDPEARVD